MLDARAADHYATGRIWRLCKAYRLSLEILLAVSPAALLAYLFAFADAELLLENHPVLQVLILVTVASSSFSGLVAWRCFAHSQEPFLRWLAAAFIACSGMSVIAGLALLHSPAPALILSQGAPRLVFSGYLLGAIFHYGSPQSPPGKAKSALWRHTGGILLLVAIVFLASILFGLHTVDVAVDVSVLGLALVSIFVLSQRTIHSPLMILYGVAVAFVAQSGIAFLVASPWSQLWWFAQAFFVAALLLMSYGTAKAFLTTRSFIRTYRQEELVELLMAANSQLQKALAETGRTNEALSRQVALVDQARAQFEAVFALSPEATLVVGPQGNILRANERARYLFGYSENAFSLLGIEDLMPIQYRQRHRELRSQHQFSREAGTMMGKKLEITALHQDGSTFLAEISLGPLHFEGESCVAVVVRDVTESQRIASQIEQTERQFRDIFDHAPIGMALTALDGHLQEVNESMCRLLGYDYDELTGMRFQDIALLEDMDSWSAVLHDIIAGKRDVCRVEQRFIKKGGTPIWSLLSISLQRNAEKAPWRILSQVVDIGGIKAAQDALADSEQQLQRVLEGSNDGFWDRHIPSGITKYSPRWATMLGYDIDDIEPDQSSWERLVHPEDLSYCRCILEEHLSGQRDRYEAVYRMRHKTGHWVWILARGKAYAWDEQGKPLRMAGTHTDVTVRQLTTEALRLRERTLKAVLDALPIGVWIADASGRITSANAAALAMVPGVRYRLLNREESSDDGWSKRGQSVTPHDWALAHAIEQRARISDELMEIEFSDGSKRTILNSGLPILDEEGAPLGAIAVNQDMTQWLKLEQDLLRRTHQLEERNRELEQFAYVASHDLQEPLRKVISFAQLFTKTYAGFLDETGQTYINFMVDGASRMQILVDDLLHYSRLTRGDWSSEDVDMNIVVDGVLTDLQLAIREAGAVIERESLPMIPGDTGQLRALMQNLVSNAVKYHSPDRTPQIHIGASRRDGETTFWIRDNGIGIDRRYFERIFVIFQRLHARSEYPGTGIGLAICRKIVENHRGRIWVESTPGQGATFFFTLPSEKAGK